MAWSSFDSPKHSSSTKHYDEIMADEPTARITLREVYDAVQSLKAELTQLPKIAEDHEDRLRDLERKVWSFAGLATLLGAALAQLVTFLLK